MMTTDGKSVKLGGLVYRVVVPMVPVAAQVSHGHLQVQFEGGAYASSSLMGCIVPSQVKAISAALKQTPPSVPSLSGNTQRLYVPLAVETGADGQVRLTIGGTGVVLCTLAVDPMAEMVSSDESVASQIEDGGEADEDDDNDD